jgi:ATP-dependent DNA helicase RecQ
LPRPEHRGPEADCSRLRPTAPLAVGSPAVEAAASAERLLKDALGEDAEFREGQLEAILSLVEQRLRVLVVERTGWGKSVVYFIATRLLREQGLGPTILISPLLSLMRDQIRMAAALNVRAETINSTNTKRWDAVEKALADDAVDLLLVSPERLGNERFQTRTLATIPREIGLFVVDEAHCISDWGHDFRPDYRRIKRITASLPQGVPLLATTATANDRVVADIEDQLGPDLVVIRGPLARESLHLAVVRLRDKAQRLAWLAEYLPQVDGNGIVYTLTVADALRVSRWLAERGIDAPAYYGGLDSDEREGLEAALRENEVKALVATVALGMGFDKPDLAFVVHFQRPSSAIDYYQQIGRAGRGVEKAEAVLLVGREDDQIADYFIESAFPPEEVMRAVLDAIAASDGLGSKEVEERVNARPSVIEQTLKLLEIDGAIAKEEAKRIRTPNRWEPDRERVEAVTAARRRELARMTEFTESGGCLMEFLGLQLDDVSARPCGHCMNCAGQFVPTEPTPALVRQALDFLNRSYRPIGPRHRWPHGLEGRSGSIDPDQRLEGGAVLAVYGDAGWGELVRDGKYKTGSFADDLVEAAAKMVESELDAEPPPTWVTAVPSLRHPELVIGFARRLADRLGLAYRSALVKAQDSPEQKTMENSFMQARNAIDSFEAVAAEVIAEPVLLVDDMVDSRWTLTICGVLLAAAGSGPVYPIALGQTTPGAAP